MAAPDTAADRERMRLTLLGGFLGSGKSTWLRHQLHAGRWSAPRVIVNEVAETPVDQLFLHKAASVSVISGGCVCCTALPALLGLLRDFADRRTRGRSEDGATRHIIVETSGLADPSPIVEALRNDPLLVHHVVLDEVVVTVDALHGLDQLASEALGHAQAEIADRIILTKVDAATPDRVRPTCATLQAINPTARIEGSDHGVEVPLPSFADVVAPRIAPPSVAAQQPIVAVPLQLGETVNWTAFGLWLSALLHARGDQVLRVKGVVKTPAGRLLLQGVRHGMQQPELLPGDAPAADDNVVVLIGRGFTAARLKASLKAFAGGA